MTWRSLLISKGGKLSLHQQQMLIQQEGKEFTVPLEDIAIVVVESRETVITFRYSLHSVYMGSLY